MSRRSTRHSLALGCVLLLFDLGLRAKLGVPLVLDPLDLGDEEFPGSFGARKVQGSLAQVDDGVAVLHLLLAVCAGFADLQNK